MTGPYRPITVKAAIPRPITLHEGPCGERIPCPVHGLPWGTYYLPAEKLANGTIVAHDCGKTWRPWELPA